MYICDLIQAPWYSSNAKRLTSTPPLSPPNLQLFLDCFSRFLGMISGLSCKARGGLIWEHHGQIRVPAPRTDLASGCCPAQGWEGPTPPSWSALAAGAWDLDCLCRGVCSYWQGLLGALSLVSEGGFELVAPEHLVTLNLMLRSLCRCVQLFLLLHWLLLCDLEARHLTYVPLSQSPRKSGLKSRDLAAIPAAAATAEPSWGLGRQRGRMKVTDPQTGGAAFPDSGSKQGWLISG